MTDSPAPVTESHAADVRGTLEEVRALLEVEANRLAAIWRQSIPAGPVDLLDEDLPIWLRRLVLNGGKRLRPIMCHWGFVAAGGQVGGAGHDQVVRLGAALEILHTFALIHDDVMDASDTRRGQPSAHVLAATLHRERHGVGSSAEFGVNLAILLGDLAHAEADRLVSELGEPVRRRWYELSIELIAGQRADLTGAAAARRDLPHAEAVARLKSGAYTVQRPLLLGALAAEADRRAYAALELYGLEIGHVFALRDDLLGVWGDPARTGKPAGDDLRNGKATVILGLADGMVTGAAAAALARVGTPAVRLTDVAFLQDALIAAGVRARVETMISDGVGRAVEALHSGSLSTAGIAGLTSMAHQIGWREK